MDKWQQREAERFAADNNVPYANAVKELFPDEQADEQAPADAGEQAPADAGEQAQAPAKAAASK